MTKMRELLRKTELFDTLVKMLITGKNINYWFFLNINIFEEQESELGMYS